MAPPLGSRVASRWAEAWLYGSGLLVAEAVVVALARRRELAASYELTRALTTIVPLTMAIALPLALLGAGASTALGEVDRPAGRRMLAAIAALAIGALAYLSSGGRLLAGARRPAFVIVAMAAAAAIAWLAGPALGRACRWLAAKSRPAALVAVGAGLAACEIANSTVLPKLYPGFHAGLAAITVAAAALGGFAWRAAAPRTQQASRAGASRAVTVFAAGLFAAAALGAVTAPRRLRLCDNLRWIYLEHAPILGYGVELAAWLEPPPPLDDELEPNGAAVGRSLDLTGRDILLVTIDAVRADHVGAYGYARNTTPRLDALAKEGAVFEAAYTATPHTSYAVASLMTGKFMRPLLLQGLGADSETLAQALRRYDYHTAAFYPPAVFFVDRERFAAFEDNGLGFEYKKEQFSPAAERAAQLRAYLAEPPRGPLFVWVHLFEPHEPYEAHSGHDFGERAIDRYDAEIAEADAGLGQLVDIFRAARKDAVVVVAADHGEEFGDHGGRYHGTSVYDEQVRVPLVVNAPGLVLPSRIKAAVGLVDLLPTLLTGAGMPVSPRVRGRDLGGLLAGKGGRDGGLAFSETDDQTLLARGSLRLVCARRVGACRLYDVAADPAERSDASAAHAGELEQMKREMRRLAASFGRFESGEGTSWPHALRRGIAGDADAAIDVASLLGDADVRIRRKAAETLFELGQGGAADGEPAPISDHRFTGDVSEPLRRALSNDEDETVRRWSALALTRLGQGAPLAFDLVRSSDREWQRLAALALAEGGDERGEQVLIDWWAAAFPAEGGAREPLLFERGKQVARALGRIKSKPAVIPLTRGLTDVRLRSFVARALATIGNEVARPALASALEIEPYHDARVAIAKALVSLGGSAELAAPLAHYLGVPDPIADGLKMAGQAHVLEWVGGPNEKELARLRKFATAGVMVGVVVPEGGNGQGLRVIVRARTRNGGPGEVRVGLRPHGRAFEDRTTAIPSKAAELDPALTVKLAISGSELREVYDSLPKAVVVKPKDGADFVIYATQNVEVDLLAIVPLADDGPVPKRKPTE